MGSGRATAKDAPVHVVVPVYAGLETTRNCLQSIIDSGIPANASVLIINDCSPDKELTAYCAEVARRENFALHVNGENLGFVATANLAFRAAAGADVILLNSDTVVANDWIDRLRNCAYREPDIGTVTPFSNNGTICSYPLFLEASPLPSAWTSAQLDDLAHRANAGVHVELPTAVGFCMYIKRRCLDETGEFDVEKFGQGYGEECDFCLRARKRGWKHVLAADTFVYHEGGVSFAGQSADRKRDADGVLHELHPEYHALVTDFIQHDPVRGYRRAIDTLRLEQRPDLAAELLDENHRYVDALLDALQELHRALDGERDRAQQLEALLDDARLKFTEVDRALGDARVVVDNLNADVRAQKTEIENGQVYARSLLDHIHNMEQSRSWRWTAWLRRKKK